MSAAFTIRDSITQATIFAINAAYAADAANDPHPTPTQPTQPTQPPIRNAISELLAQNKALQEKLARLQAQPPPPPPPPADPPRWRTQCRPPCRPSMSTSAWRNPRGPPGPPGPPLQQLEDTRSEVCSLRQQIAEEAVDKRAWDAVSRECGDARSEVLQLQRRIASCPQLPRAAPSCRERPPGLRAFFGNGLRNCLT